MTPGQTDAGHGTPADYTGALYCVYVEVGEWKGLARDAISDFLVERSRELQDFHFSPSDIRARQHGYEVDLPMQLIPELVRALTVRNVAIYQVLRLQRV